MKHRVAPLLHRLRKMAHGQDMPCGTPTTACALPAGEGLHERHFVGLRNWHRKFKYDFVVHENSHVLADLILLVDRPKSYANKSRIEIVEHFGNRRTVRVDPGFIVGVRAERSGYANSRHYTCTYGKSACSTL